MLHDGLAVDARLHRLELPGLRLLVGRDETERSELRRLLTEGVVWASGAVVLFALVGAWLIRHALQARMRPAFATTAAIAGGDLSSRVALSGRGDEFDRLAQTLNTMLDRIGTLMEGVRGVSDAIAHDLRTPIARARAKLEDALATRRTRQSLRAAVEQGIADLDGISRIFQALLRIAEAEAGARRAAFAPLDLVHVLADAAEIYEVDRRGARPAAGRPTCRSGWRSSATATCCCRRWRTCWTTPSNSPRRRRGGPGCGTVRLAPGDRGGHRGHGRR